MVLAVVALAVSSVNLALTLLIWWDVRHPRARLGDGDGARG